MRGRGCGVEGMRVTVCIPFRKLPRALVGTARDNIYWNNRAISIYTTNKIIELSQYETSRRPAKTYVNISLKL